MAQQNSGADNTVPKTIGGFNIPKAVIENKVDVLTFLEILVRKNIITPEELDSVRAAVVAHLNIMYPELQLSYTTPEAMASQAPLPQEMTTQVAPAQVTPGAAAPAAQVPAASVSSFAPPAKTATPPPLFHQAPPPKFIK
jgi:hypothetical protein